MDFFIAQERRIEFRCDKSWDAQLGDSFGAQFHPSLRDVIILSSDNFTVQKQRRESYKPCLVYSAHPLQGGSVFEVEMSLNSPHPAGRLIIGVCRVPKNCPVTQFQQATLPYESSDYCVWHDGAVWNNLSVIHTKKPYGSVHLMNLRSQDKVGFMITPASDLAFYVNGRCQGLAARNVHLESCDTYAVVTMLESCESIHIIKSGE